eukprot:TRINITY_DN1878_c0_g1_i1.p1 TRINITY_DN1878_c0_g1~~TRINITY_DN1878_c0_g1_i1.p1  ORF type:complete len:246 (-),score=42.83 TRINITY_DN1878_c0_g1_i1:455-1123(-)
MTIIWDEDITCAVCGATSKVPTLASTNSFGSSDLDTRPPPMQRDTMHTWVTSCQVCGYVSPDLTTLPEGIAKETVADFLRSDAFAPLSQEGQASVFARYAVILDKLEHDNVQAGWNSMRSAWCHDDRGDDNLACISRMQAVQFFNAAQAEGKKCMDDVGGDALLCTDLLRRAGQFEQALVECDKGLALDGVVPIIKSILEYEKGLIGARDTKCHKVEEAVKE